MENEITSKLNIKEKELLQLLSLGLSKNSVAMHLNISKYTVDKHLRNVFEKLNLHSTVAVVAYALRSREIE
jgi:DNA-binding CsgD family transcriptional regulator